MTTSRPRPCRVALCAAIFLALTDPDTRGGECARDDDEGAELTPPPPPSVPLLPPRAMPAASAAAANVSSLSKFLTEPQLGTSWYDPNGPTPNFVRGQKNGTVYESQLGGDALLDCHVTALERDLVSWLFVREAPRLRHGGHGQRRRDQRVDLVVLTVGFKPHSAENRFILDFEPPNNYRLRIRNVQWRDEGRYVCQLSVHPPSVMWRRLRLLRPLVHLLDGELQPVSSLHYDEGSTVHMACRVKTPPLYHTSVVWKVTKSEVNSNATNSSSSTTASDPIVQILNQDVTRGGVKVDTGRDADSGHLVSRLSLARAVPSDTGNYTCSLLSVPQRTGVSMRGLQDSIAVHVLQGENTEAIYSGATERKSRTWTTTLFVVLLSSSL